MKAPTIPQDVTYHWCVMLESRPGEPLQKGPSEEECRRWIEIWQEGYRPDAFYVARRPVGGWERV